MVGVIHCKLATLIHLCLFFSLKHVRRMLGEGECENCELEKGAMFEIDCECASSRTVI